MRVRKNDENDENTCSRSTTNENAKSNKKKKTLQQTNESLQQHKIVYLPQRNGERDES